MDQPSDNQPSEDQPSENQPNENQPSENQPSENQPSENQPSENQQSEKSPEEKEKILPTSPKTAQSTDDTENSSGCASEEKKLSSDTVELPSVEDIIAVCEIRLRKHLKRQREERLLAESRGYTFFDASNEARITGESSTENVFIGYYEDPTDYTPKNKKRQKVVIGSWLFLSFMSGGWSYDIMKRYIIREYGVKFLKDVSEKMVGEYKAVVKCKSSEELNRIVTSLLSKNIHSKFLFFSFDKIPITYYDSDSDE